MNALIAKISGDPVLMLSAAVGAVVILFVVLVVIIATMRVKTYKDRFVNTEIDNIEKEKHIAELEHELKRYQMDNAQQAQLLKAFDDTKSRLNDALEKFSQTERVLSETQKALARTEAELANANERYDAIKQEHEALQERIETVQEENNRLRVNNARLLMKLETGEQFAAHLEQRRHIDEEK